ncbi:ATP-binding protein [Streptomyces sp. JJ66]|uniref:ATP-binding protein n=1 Tax=Streptomyces sp. JJ66 TaxID=2803843 RepID=UPI001C58D075|nr:ATP-binding protein [Streptomyces sp. JJ66]MBW1601882.1 ATP-binding protein [Streptomyces sp. JJ66]
MSTTRPSAAGERGPEPKEAPQPASAASVAPGVAGTPPHATAPAGPGRGAAHQLRRLRLVGVSGAVQRSRDFTREALRDWGWLPAPDPQAQAAAEDVLLVVSELVTNACLHAGGPQEVRIAREDAGLRLEVTDAGSGEPAPRTPHQAGRPGGHGMFIVERLCKNWGVAYAPDGVGKTVWAELTPAL